MESLDEAPGSETARQNNNPWEPENRSEICHNRSLLLGDPVKPCQQTRVIVKGSGIPEVRTMLAGIEMPHYLSLTNMFTKFLGLICTLAAGSTVFLGKVEGAAGEMLVVAAAVGVASCFGAPISGVLFSVEVMCSHFALRHYCPCFFSAACGALTFCLLSVWSGDAVFLMFRQRSEWLSSISQYTTKQLLTTLLDSTQWTSQSHNASVEPLLEWSSSGSPVYLSLAVFLLMKLWMLVLACTLPLPAGYFMPVFVYGAALGRLLGEGVASTGVTSGQQWASINPGGYALAGAAAFSGAVTHTLSPALLAVELTGQFSHAVPILLATLLANAVARSGHRPSFYDALSISKKLPHLPSLMKASPRLPSTLVGQVLGVKSVQLRKAAGPEEVQHAVNTSTETQIPVVDSHESQILLGFVLRSELLMFLRHCETQSLDKHMDDVCSIYPTSVLLSPHNTIQEA
ncbi:Chloride channel protein [Collichthys lucidus]|uniref:Chloride channel protein n=1 Tax=Collichthys lucidus TaxID=240159 RepID=A0A4U5UQ66_COLLU|nr:Chloride channel protein [Collichthys lucidus]